MLRAYLRYFNVDREINSVLVASAAPGDGKTTVARNLAEAAQETGTKTLLLDAELRRPDMAAYYGIQQSPGLSELLSGHVQPPGGDPFHPHRDPREWEHERNRS